MNINNKNEPGFTIIELAVVIVIIVLLSGIVLSSVNQYINKGKDSSVSGNLAVLIPAGEVYYNKSGYSYVGFCDPTNYVFINVKNPMPNNPDGACVSSNPKGVCCSVNASGSAWAACATEFNNKNMAFCVDSRGVRREINNSECNNSITVCPES